MLRSGFQVRTVSTGHLACGMTWLIVDPARMSELLNRMIAGHLEEAAEILRREGADPQSAPHAGRVVVSPLAPSRWLIVGRA